MFLHSTYVDRCGSLIACLHCPFVALLRYSLVRSAMLEDQISIAVGDLLPDPLPSAFCVDTLPLSGYLPTGHVSPHSRRHPTRRPLDYMVENRNTIRRCGRIALVSPSALSTSGSEQPARRGSSRTGRIHPQYPHLPVCRAVDPQSPKGRISPVRRSASHDRLRPSHLPV